MEQLSFLPSQSHSCPGKIRAKDPVKVNWFKARHPQLLGGGNGVLREESQSLASFCAPLPFYTSACLLCDAFSPLSNRMLGWGLQGLALAALGVPGESSALPGTLGQLSIIPLTLS